MDNKTTSIGGVVFVRTEIRGFREQVGTCWSTCPGFFLSGVEEGRAMTDELMSGMGWGKGLMKIVNRKLQVVLKSTNQ